MERVETDFSVWNLCWHVFGILKFFWHWLIVKDETHNKRGVRSNVDCCVDDSDSFGVNISFSIADN